jgi:hypothetical protein
MTEGYSAEDMNAIWLLNISLEIAEQDGSLTGVQVRFLRRLLNDSVLQLAERIGTGIWDVVRCEKRDLALPPHAEEALKRQFIPLCKRIVTTTGAPLPRPNIA